MNCTGDSKIRSFLKFILFIWHKGMTDPQADVLQNRLWPHSYTETKKKKKWWFTCTFLALRYWFNTKYVLRHNVHTFRKVNVNGSSHLIVLASLLCPPSLQQKTWEVTMPCSQMVRRDIKQFPANSHLYWGENERKARETDWQLKGSSENEL